MRTHASTLSCLVLFSVGCLGDPELDRTSGNLEGGQPEYGRPEVLKMTAGGSMCTATLVHPRVAMTAKHCIDASTQASQLAFYSGQTGGTYEASGAELFYYGELLGHSYQPDDFLLVVLDRVVGIAPAVPRSQPLGGSDIAGKVRMVGFGGTTADHRGAGAKTSGTATISVVGQDTFQTLRNAAGEVVCRKGDSGGPVFYQGEVAGVMFAAPGAGILYDARMGGHRCEVTRVDQYPETMARAVARAEAITAWERGAQGGGPNAGSDDEYGQGAGGEGEGEGEGEGDEAIPPQNDPGDTGDPCDAYDWQSYCVDCDGWDDAGDGCCAQDLEDPQTCGPSDEAPSEEPPPDCSCDADCGDWGDCCAWCPEQG